MNESRLHSHECENCFKPLSCWCPNKHAKVYCIECGDLLEQLLLDLAKKWGVEVAA